MFGYEYLSGSNLLHRLTKPNGMTLTQSYESHRNLLTGMAYHRGTTLVAQREYVYDTLGRPTARNTARKGTVVNDTFVHNTRSELTAAQVNGENYQYNYDNIGNRAAAVEDSSGVASRTEYTANELNQYTTVGDFTPTFDTDGNQTRIKTATGIWEVIYNAENRPIRFTSEDKATVIECSYDSMGRRATKKVTVNGEVTLHQLYIYRGYLQIACCDLTRSGHPCLWLLAWDPTQTVATRPLAIRKDGSWFAYGWDLTKNICEVFGPAGYIRTAYTYSPYGKVTNSGDVEQPIQWSSEFNDKELALTYYNFRHYNSESGRWIGRDLLSEKIDKSLYVFASNATTHMVDVCGLAVFPQRPLIMPQKCIDCKKEIYIFIGGAMDSDIGPMYNTLLYTYQKTYQKNDAGYAYYHWDIGRKQILDTINTYRSKCPKSKVIILGHSYGGDTAMDIAERLPSNQKIVLVTLDPVSNYDSFNYSRSVPSSVEYWINAYVSKGPHDWVGWIPIAGQLIAGVGTLVSGGGWNDTVASLGGKWGYESSADINLRFDYYGNTNHGNARDLLYSNENSAKKSAYEILQNYIQK